MTKKRITIIPTMCTQHACIHGYEYECRFECLTHKEAAQKANREEVVRSLNTRNKNFQRGHRRIKK